MSITYQPFTKKKWNKDVPTPIVETTPEVFKSLKEFILAEDKHEIMAFGIIERHENNFKLIDFLIPPQENTAATVTTSDDKYQEWLQEIPRKTRTQMKMHIHTHPSKSVSPSTTDETTMKEQIENIDDYYIRVITSKHLNFHIDLWNMEQKLLFKNIPLTIKTETFSLKIGEDSTDIHFDNLNPEPYKKILKVRKIQKTYVPPYYKTTTTTYPYGYANKYEEHYKKELNKTVIKDPITPTVEQLEEALDFFLKQMESGNESTALEKFEKILDDDVLEIYLATEAEYCLGVLTKQDYIDTVRYSIQEEIYYIEEEEEEEKGKETSKNEPNKTNRRSSAHK